MVGDLPSPSGGSPWIDLLFSGVGVVFFGALVTQVKEAAKRRVARKAQPVQEESARTESLEISMAEVQLGLSQVKDWLIGGKDLLGRSKGDGFIETYPKFQQEVRDGFKGINGRLDKIVPDGDS